MLCLDLIYLERTGDVDGCIERIARQNLLPLVENVATKSG